MESSLNVINCLERKIDYTDQDYQDIVEEMRNPTGGYSGYIIPSDKWIETNEDWWKHYRKFEKALSWLYDGTIVDRGYDYVPPGGSVGYVASITRPIDSSTRQPSGTWITLLVDPIDIVVGGNFDCIPYKAITHLESSANFQAQWFNESCQRMVNHLNIRLRRLGQLEISDNYRLTPLPNPFAFYQPQNPNQGDHVADAPTLNLYPHQ